MGAIHLAKNSVTSQKSKHIDLRHHFIRDHVVNKNIVVQYVPTTEMPADVLTKPLTKVKHEQCIKQFGLVCD